MVGDSAVSYGTAPSRKVKQGAAKIQYSERHNIGFAMWGHGTVNGVQLDKWLDNFIFDIPEDADDIEKIGNRLAASLQEELRKENRPWSELVLGIHIVGYKNRLPRLWHIHCGCFSGPPYSVPPHEPRLFKDYPENKDWTDSEYQSFLESGGTYHFRNGYYPHYAVLFEHVQQLANDFRQKLKIDFPKQDLEGRLEFHKILVRFVADVLVAAGEHQGVSDPFSYIAFAEDGIKTDQRLRVIDWLSKAATGGSQALWL
jgi:hypothetical protein